MVVDLPPSDIVAMAVTVVVTPIVVVSIGVDILHVTDVECSVVDIEFVGGEVVGIYVGSRCF